MEKNKLVEANGKIAEGVVQGYKKIEDGVVSGFTKLTDKVVGTFLTKDGESVEDAKARMADEQKVRDAEQKAGIEASLEAGKNI